MSGILFLYSLQIAPMTRANLRKTFAPFIATVLILNACQETEPSVSKEEALNLAHRIERTMNKHDTPVLNPIFDEKALEQRVAKASDIFLSRTMINSAVKGIEQSGLGSKVVRAMGDQG